jgi:hypothetical protein
MRSIVLELIGTTLDDAVQPLNEALGVQLEERDSSFWGGRYFTFGGPCIEEIYVFSNLDTLDPDEVIKCYPEADESSWMVRIDKTERDAQDVLASVTARGLSARILRHG